jgi:1-acyl-sn-glycerol-3-phosphate acyltransferase
MSRPLPARIWYRLLQGLIVLAASLFFRIRYRGRRNIPATGGVLAVCNHQSHLDPPLVGSGSWRRMNYLARETLFGFAPFAWLIRSVDAIPIDREGVGLGGIKESLKRLKRGEIVVIFPEGTRTTDGEIAPFKPGFTALAVRSGAAILPMAIDGAFQAWPKSRKFPWPGKIRILYGEPISPAEIAEMDDRHLAATVERRVRECLAELRKG